MTATVSFATTLLRSKLYIHVLAFRKIAFGRLVEPLVKVINGTEAPAGNAVPNGSNCVVNGMNVSSKSVSIAGVTIHARRPICAQAKKQAIVCSGSGRAIAMMASLGVSATHAP